MKRPLCLLFVMTLLISADLRAETAPEAVYASIRDVPKVLLSVLRDHHPHPDEYSAQLLNILQYKKADARGLTQQDVDAFARFLKRSESYTKFIEAALFDTDFDKTVTPQEILLYLKDNNPRSYKDEASASAEVKRIMDKFDLDHDNMISLSEMSAPDKDTRRPERHRGHRMAEALMKLDPDADGILTALEIDLLARKAFTTVDSDKDGTISSDEQQEVVDFLEEF